MTPTDEIRAKLDERGVDYQIHDGGNRACFYFDYNERCGDFLKSIDVVGECIIASQSYLTPEQAIAATVGTEPDEQDMLKLHDRMNAALLDMQEELLAYHPRDRENASSKKLIGCVIAAHQIIEDAATVVAGTCKDLGGTGANGEDVFNCSECGCVLSLYDGEGVNTLCTSFIHDYPRFCPECGARVVSE